MRFIFIWFVFLLGIGFLGPSASANSVDSLTFDNPSDSLAGPGGAWFTDVNYNPVATFSTNSTNFAPNNVLQVDISASEHLSAPLNYQGYVHGFASPTTSISFDFYVDPDPSNWSGQSVYTGIFGVSDSRRLISDITYQHNYILPVAGFYFSDGIGFGDANGYLGAGNVGWNNLRMDLDPNVGTSFFLNGVQSGFIADTTGAQAFNSLALVSYNFRLDQNQTFYYDNIGTDNPAGSSPVPLPTSVWMGGSMMLIWLGIWRLPKYRRYLV